MSCPLRPPRPTTATWRQGSPGGISNCPLEAAPCEPGFPSGGKDEPEKSVGDPGGRPRGRGGRRGMVLPPRGGGRRSPAGLREHRGDRRGRERQEPGPGAGAGVAAAQAEAERLSREFIRAKALHARDVISRQELERAQAAFEIAEERRKEARESLLLVEEGARREQIDQARARVRQAKEALELARTRLSYATVASPLAGVVLSKNAEPGDYVAAGTPVVTVGDLADVWLRAYIEETELGRVKVGQPVDVTADTYPGKTYAGRISFIAPQAEFTPKSVQTRKHDEGGAYDKSVQHRQDVGRYPQAQPADGVVRFR